MTLTEASSSIFKMEQKQREHAGDTDNNEFGLDMVLELGGNEKDYLLLNNLEDAGEDIEDSLDLDAEPIKKDDIKNFISDLGIAKIMNYTEENQNTKTPKLLSRPMTEEELNDHESNAKNSNKKTKNKFKVQENVISSTTTQVTGTSHVFKLNEEPKKRNYLLVKAGRKWQEHIFTSDPNNQEAISGDIVNKYANYAAKLLENEVKLYQKEQENKKSSNLIWIRTVLSSGTASDKSAALTLQIQDAPIHNLKSLDALLTMCSKKGKREALLALDTLKELFLNDLLVNRKLRTFEQNPLLRLEVLASGNQDSRDKRLLMWYYESQLKSKFGQFIEYLKTIGHDTVLAAKKKALSTTYELLVSTPEQEKMLLAMLINKLGDPDHKLASKVAHLLKCVVDKHPNMKSVVVLEVERLMYRPNISTKAQYYAVCFLNQLTLSHTEKELGSRLIDIYFSFFKVFVKKGEVDSKMLSGLLTGVNRAYPFAKENLSKVEESMDTLYRIVHIVNFNTSIQALMLLFQAMGTSNNVTDRYFMALYRKLLDPGLHTSSKQAMFLNLLYKSMKMDLVTKRVKAFIKRLLQVCCYQTPTFICGALVLLSEITKGNKGVLSLAKVAEESDDEEERFVDAPSDTDDSSPKSDATARESLASSWVHRKHLGCKSESGDYDPSQRNPLYCQADVECVWELEKLSRHYHPTVALFAQNILTGQNINYTGDPLQDFSLIRFLDRFVYRNPKKSTTEQNSMSTIKSNPKGIRAVPVNSKHFLKMEENIPVDERFFYKYFKMKADKLRIKESVDSDNEDVSDGEFDEFLTTHEAGFDGADDFEMDFAGELAKYKSKRKGKKEIEDDSEEDDDLDLSEEEVDFEDDEDLKAAFDSEGEEDLSDVGFDEEGVDFSEDDMDFQASPNQKKRKHQDDDDFDEEFLPGSSKKSRGKINSTENMFAAAEEFAHLIDENAGSSYDMIGSDAVSNYDKAGAKQLKWEAKRDSWVKDNNWKNKKSKGKKKQRK